MVLCITRVYNEDNVFFLHMYIWECDVQYCVEPCANFVLCCTTGADVVGDEKANSSGYVPLNYHPLLEAAQLLTLQCCKSWVLRV